MSGVSSVALARWEDVQAELRNLTLQRGLRFIAVAVLVPFGVSGVEKERAGPNLSAVVFGVTLLFLAVAEVASMVQSGLRMAQRRDLEKADPILATKGRPGRLARALGFLSGPGASAALYALLGAAFILGGALPWT
ncbi:MAG: hypothetical protein AABY18_05535 [Candidatus Thermoplasmatota archaeon]